MKIHLNPFHNSFSLGPLESSPAVVAEPTDEAIAVSVQYEADTPSGGIDDFTHYSELFKQPETLHVHADTTMQVMDIPPLFSRLLAQSSHSSDDDQHQQVSHSTKKSRIQHAARFGKYLRELLVILLIVLVLVVACYAFSHNYCTKNREHCEELYELGLDVLDDSMLTLNQSYVSLFQLN